jgi:steroid delta-isomerase-like uncharacterized protein
MRQFGTLVVLIMVMTLGLLAVPGRRIGAQEATQSATPAALPPLLVELVAAWNAHDPQRVASFYTEDATVEVGFLGEVIARGRDEIANEFVAGNLAAIPDWRFETRSGYATAGRIIWEWTYTGTYSGQYEGMPAGTGQPVSLRGVTIFELRDGLIARDVFYDDFLGFLEQTGLLEKYAQGTLAAGTPAP